MNNNRTHIDVSGGRGMLSRRQLITRGALIGLSAPLLGSSLAACGTRQGAGGGSEGGAITMAINESPWLGAFEKLAADYSKQSGNTVTLRAFPPANLQTKELNAVQNKSGEFDIYTMFGTWYGSFYNAGFLEPFDKIDSGYTLDDEVITYDDLIKWDSDSGYYSPEGSVMAMPANGNFQIFYYRKDIYDKLGLSVPETYEDVIANAKAITKGSDAEYGYAIRGQKGSNGATVGFMPILRGLGGDIFASPPEDWTVTINSDTALEAMELYLELASLGPKDAHSIGQAELIALTQSGKLAQTTMVSAAAANLQDDAQSYVVGKIGCSIVPRPNDGKAAPTALPALAGIPAHIESDKKKIAYEFLTWLTGKKSQLQFAKNGGSPARKDVLSSDLADDHPEYAPMLESAPIATRDIAYPFAPELLQVTERRINEIVAKSVEPKKGLDTAASEIEKVLADAGFK